MKTVNGFVPTEQHSVTSVMGSVYSSGTLCGWRFIPNTRCAKTHFFFRLRDINKQKVAFTHCVRSQGHSETRWMSHVLRLDLVTARCPSRCPGPSRVSLPAFLLLQWAWVWF